MVNHTITVQDWTDAHATTTRPIFAIGDVHGEADRLETLHRTIQEIVAADDLQNPQIIHLGDYIDRGPRSLAALRMAVDGIYPDDVALYGNHEMFLYHFLTSGRHFGLWLKNGAWRILEELGVEFTWTEDGIDIDSIDQAAFRKLLIDLIGKNRLDKLFERSPAERHQRYLFIHAGIHPLFSVEQNLEYDCLPIPNPWTEDRNVLWVRGPFLTHMGRFDENVIVVHGHTITSEPQLLSNRIGLDTGASRGGPLSAVQLMGDQLRLIQVRNAPAEEPET